MENGTKYGFSVSHRKVEAIPNHTTYDSLTSGSQSRLRISTDTTRPT
jgi:hypothetical protein